MFKQGKYLLGNIREKGFPVQTAVLFPETITHRYVARTLFGGDVQSAGFYRIEEDGSVSVFGDSPSIGLASDKADIPFICMALGKPLPSKTLENNEVNVG